MTWRADWECGLGLGLAIEEFEMSEIVGKKHTGYYMKPVGMNAGRLPKTKKPPKKAVAQAKRGSELGPLVYTAALNISGKTKNVFDVVKPAETIEQRLKLQLEKFNGEVAELRDRNDLLGRPEWERREIEQRKLHEDKVVVHLPPSEVAKLDMELHSLGELREKLSEKIPQHYVEKYSANQLPKTDKLEIEGVFKELRKIDRLIAANRSQRNAVLNKIRQNLDLILKLDLRIDQIKKNIEIYEREHATTPARANKSDAANDAVIPPVASGGLSGFLDFLGRGFDDLEVSILESK